MQESEEQASEGLENSTCINFFAMHWVGGKVVVLSKLIIHNSVVCAMA
jgi:hypothetical protein